GVVAVGDLERSNVTVDREPDPQAVRVTLVSGGYFALLGVQAQTGRALTTDDDRVPGGHPVAAISDGYRRRWWPQASDAIRRTLTIGETTYQILGVLPPGFTGDSIGHPTDVWIPIAMQSQVMVERPGLLAGGGGTWTRIV